MLKIKIVAIGKIKERALSELICEYAKRLGRYCSLEIIEVADESISARESGAGVIKLMRIEAERVLERLRPGAYYTIALDMGGTAMDSEAFAKNVGALSGAYPQIVFIIGGSHGLHPDVLARSDFVFSMSELTFPHQLARLVLLEQLYRAFKINSNETYHK